MCKAIPNEKLCQRAYKQEYAVKKKKSERCAKSYDWLRLFCINLYS